MTFSVEVKLIPWDVTEVMTLNEVHAVCRKHQVTPRVTNGRIIIPVYEYTEGDE